MNFPQARLLKLLTEEAGMDGADAETAIRRLTKGKSVDVTFDTGEDKAARDFVRKVPAHGLTAEFYQDEPLRWIGSRPRPLFLKLSMAVLVGFGVCLWLYSRWPDSRLTRITTIAEGLIILFWLYSSTGGLLDRKPQSEAVKDWHRKIGFWWGLGLTGALMLIAGITARPAYGLILLILAAAGIGCALLIRTVNRG